MPRLQKFDSDLVRTRRWLTAITLALFANTIVWVVRGGWLMAASCAFWTFSIIMIRRSTSHLQEARDLVRLVTAIRREMEEHL
jgi:uncharacterized membrane protein YjjP (DUF1212 family)